MFEEEFPGVPLVPGVDPHEPMPEAVKRQLADYRAAQADPEVQEIPPELRRRFTVKLDGLQMLALVKAVREAAEARGYTDVLEVSAVEVLSDALRIGATRGMAVPSQKRKRKGRRRR